MSATKATAALAELYTALAEAIAAAQKAGLDGATIQVAIEKTAELVGECDE